MSPRFGIGKYVDCKFILLGCVGCILENPDSQREVVANGNSFLIACLECLHSSECYPSKSTAELGLLTCSRDDAVT